MCGGCPKQEMIERIIAERRRQALEPISNGPHLFSGVDVGIDKDGFKRLLEDKELAITERIIGGHPMIEIYLRVPSERVSHKLKQVQAIFTTHRPEKVMAELRKAAMTRSLAYGTPRFN